MNRGKKLVLAASAAILGTMLWAPIAGAQQTGPEKTIRQAFRTGCMAGPLYTTCGNRLDETVLQG